MSPGRRFAHRKAVDGKLTHGHGVLEAAGFRPGLVPADVQFRQGVEAHQAARLANVELEGEVPVVGKLVQGQVILPGNAAMGRGRLRVLLQEPQQAQRQVADPGPDLLGESPSLP